MRIARLARRSLKAGITLMLTVLAYVGAIALIFVLVTFSMYRIMQYEHTLLGVSTEGVEHDVTSDETLIGSLHEHEEGEYGKYAKACASQLGSLGKLEGHARATLAKTLGTDSMTGKMYVSAVDDATRQLRVNCQQVLDMMDDDDANETEDRMRSLVDSNSNILDGLTDIAKFGSDRQYKQVKDESDAISSNITALGDRIRMYD